MYKIMIVDDEADIVKLLKDYFEINGYQTQIAYNGKEAIELVNEKPDIILLDVNMPDMDGIEVCTLIREHVSCPILFLTAKAEDSDKIEGFAAGGDDYILKPFSIDELGARVAAHIRREHRNAQENKIRFYGKLMIDYSGKSIFYDGTPMRLAKKEYEIVEFLSLNQGQVFDKEQIYEKLWGYDAEGDSSVISEHVRKIRVKLKAVGEEHHLETVWGMGYRWNK